MAAHPPSSLRWPPPAWLSLARAQSSAQQGSGSNVPRVTQNWTGCYLSLALQISPDLLKPLDHNVCKCSLPKPKGRGQQERGPSVDTGEQVPTKVCGLSASLACPSQHLCTPPGPGQAAHTTAVQVPNREGWTIQVSGAVLLKGTKSPRAALLAASL